MKKISIRLQIIYFILIGLFLSVVGWLFLGYQMRLAHQEIDKLNTEQILIIRYCLRISESLDEVLFLSQNAKLVKDKAMQALSEAALEKKLNSYTDSLYTLSDKVTEVTLKREIQSLRQETAGLENIMDYFSRTDREDLTKLALADKNIKDIQNKISRLLKNIYNYQENEIRTNFSYIENKLNTSLFIYTVWTFFMGFLFIFSLFYVLELVKKYISTKTFELNEINNGNIPFVESTNYEEFIEFNNNFDNLLIERMNRLKNMAEQIGQGIYSTTIRVFDGKGAMGESLAKMRANLEQIALENEERNWMNESIAKFGEVLRHQTQDKMDDFYDEIITTLVTYTQANQGGLFILSESNEGDPIMVLEASFAMERKKYIKNTVQVDEGLIGQSWREKEIVYLTDIPDNYTHINSGLGSKKPNSIIIVPLISNDEVLGVVELSSFGVFLPRHIEFVNRVSNSVGISVKRIKDDLYNREVFQNSQILSKKMKKTEQNLLQSKKELEDQLTQELAVETDLKAQLEALNFAFCFNELDIKGFYKNMNTNMLNLLGYTEKEIIGKHFTVLVKDKLKIAREDWVKVLKGDIVKGEYLRHTKDGRVVWLYEVMFPYRNEKGIVEKVYTMGYDITNYKNISRNVLIPISN